MWTTFEEQANDQLDQKWYIEAVTVKADGTIHKLS